MKDWSKPLHFHTWYLQVHLAMILQAEITFLCRFVLFFLAEAFKLSQVQRGTSVMASFMSLRRYWVQVRSLTQNFLQHPFSFPCLNVNFHGQQGPEPSGKGFHPASLQMFLDPSILLSWLVSQNAKKKTLVLRILMGWVCAWFSFHIPFKNCDTTV